MIKKLIKKWLGLYDLHDLRVGANCGCCGAWIPEEIVEKDYAWGLCNNCENMGYVSPHVLPDRPWPKPPPIIYKGCRYDPMWERKQNHKGKE